MIEKFLRLLKGNVLISIKGGQPERFLNLCISRKIPMENIRHTEEMEITAVLSLEDFFKLRPIRSKTKVHIRVLERHGLPFFFYRNKKRKAFFLGILLCFLLMTGFSTRIWNIHVEGNQRNTTPEILEFLEQEGICHGMAKDAVNCGEIAASLRKKYPEVAWVSARMEGTRLILNIQEGLMVQHTAEAKGPCNISSGMDGTIVEMITRKGVPMMKPGDSCKKGDLLVSGELHIMNDSQEVVRCEFVHADADIYVQHPLAYYQEFPLEYQTEIPTGKIKHGFFLKIGKIYLGLYPKTGETWRRIEQEYPLQLTENFFLPVSVGKVELTEYTSHTSACTKEQAESLALEKFHKYEEKILEKGIRITENHITTEITDISCITKGYLTVIEKNGLETPLSQQAEPVR